MIGAPLPLAEVLEKDWDAQLFNAQKGLATTLGWTLSYHTLRSKGSRSGFPDRVLVRDRIVYAELKREKTNPTAEQVRWLDGLARAGAEVYLWRPSDLDEIGRVLSRRWQFVPFGSAEQLATSYPKTFQDSLSPALASDGPWWQPGSIWVPGVGRADEVRKA